MTDRPLSPHLQVYRLPMAAIMSISHRLTGVILIFGTMMITAWLAAAAMGEQYYNIAMYWAETNAGTFLMFGWSFALYYHLCNGIRHMIWDTGRLMSRRAATVTGWIVIFAALGLTAATWYCVREFR